MSTGPLSEAGPARRKDGDGSIKGAASEWKFRVKYFLGLLAISYVLMRLIVYLTRVLAYYFLYGVWRFF